MYGATSSGLACVLPDGKQREPSLLELPVAILQLIFTKLGRGAGNAYATCRQLRRTWLLAVSTPGSAAGYLLAIYGNQNVFKALYGQCAPILACCGALDETRVSHQTPTDHVAQNTQRPIHEGETALAFYRALCGLGVKPDTSLLAMAAGAGHTQVVQELLGSGSVGLNPNPALFAVLRNAKDLERTRELVDLLEGAGATASPMAWIFELVHNRNGHMTSVLLHEYSLREPGDSDALLQGALSARNCGFARELLDAGAQPLPGALLPASKTGDDSLFERVLRSGVCTARDPEVLLSVVQSGRVGMLTQLLGPAAWPPEEPALREALASACSAGSMECAEALLGFSVDPVAAEALEAAARSGSPGLLRLLLGTGRYAAAQPALGAALEVVCRLPSAECAELLLCAGVDPASTSALALAVTHGPAGLVHRLLATGRYAGAQDRLGAALQNACLTNSVECLNALLRAGVDPVGTRALSCAAAANSLQTLRMLLDTGRFPPGHCQLGYALLEACREGHLDTVQVLLGAGADPTAGLEVAGREAHSEVLRALLATGRCPPQSRVVQCALDSACFASRKDGRYLEVVKALLDAGAMPVHHLANAACAGQVALVRMLVATGRCPPDHPGMVYALQAACRWYCVDTARELLSAGVDPTPALLIAVCISSAPLLRLLLGASRGPAEQQLNRLNVSLWYACTRQYLEMVQDLLTAGADPACVVSCPAVRTNPEIRAALAATGRFPALPETTDAADGNDWIADLNKLLTKAGYSRIAPPCRA